MCILHYSQSNIVNDDWLMSVNVHCDSARRFYAVVSIVHNLYAIKLRQIVKIEIITIHVNAIIGTILRRIRHLMKLLESN